MGFIEQLLKTSEEARWRARVSIMWVQQIPGYGLRGSDMFLEIKLEK